MIPRVHRVLLPAAVLRRRVKNLGAQISRDYRGRNLTVVSVLKGSVIFLADLLRALTIPCAVDFMAVSSYKGTRSTGSLRVTLDLRESPEGKNILLVEDIVDTGLTLAYLRNLFLARNARSFRVCALLDKPARRRAPVKPDYAGFAVPDEFVVGYGLDHRERFRELPYIGALKFGRNAKK